MRTRMARECVGALLLLLLAGPAPGAAQTLADYDYEDLTLRGVGMDYGYLWPNRVAQTPSYNLRLDLGYLGPAVRVVSSLGYWRSTLDDGEIDRLAEQLNQLEALRARNVTVAPGELGAIDWSGASADVAGHLVWHAPFAALAYTGVGAGLHALNGRGAAIDDTFIEDLLDTLAPGAAVMAGVEAMPLDRLRIYGEARYDVLSNLRYAGVRIGAAFMLSNEN